MPAVSFLLGDLAKTLNKTDRLLDSLFYAKRLGRHCFNLVLLPPLLTVLQTETNRLGKHHCEQEDPDRALTLRLRPPAQPLHPLPREPTLHSAHLRGQTPNAGPGRGVRNRHLGH